MPAAADNPYRGSLLDHLRGSSSRRERGRMPVMSFVLQISANLLVHLPHRSDQKLRLLLRRKRRQSGRTRQLHIDTDTVCQFTCPMNQQRIGPRHQLGMDISRKAILLPKERERERERQGRNDSLHRLRRFFSTAELKNKSLDIIAPIKLRWSAQQSSCGSKRSSGDIIAPAVHTIRAVKNTAIAVQYLQAKGDASPVRRPGMADPACFGITDSALPIPIYSAGCAGYIKLGGSHAGSPAHEPLTPSSYSPRKFVRTCFLYLLCKSNMFSFSIQSITYIFSFCKQTFAIFEVFLKSCTVPCIIQYCMLYCIQLQKFSLSQEAIQ